MIFRELTRPALTGESFVFLVYSFKGVALPERDYNSLDIVPGSQIFHQLRFEIGLAGTNSKDENWKICCEFTSKI